MEFGIVGTGRCGTSVLHRMLDCHPEIFVFPETHWIPKMFEFFGTGLGDVDTLIGIIQNTRFAHGERVTPLDVVRLKQSLAGAVSLPVAEFCDVVGLLFAHDAGKSRWADKTPDYGPYMKELQILWPQCRFVHVIRNGTEVARSMRGHPGFRWMAAAGETWWCPASFNGYHTAVERREAPPGAFLDLWRRRLLRIRDEATRLRPGTYLEVHYEDLVADPEATLQRVGLFLGLDLSGEWLSQAIDRVDRSRRDPRWESDRAPKAVAELLAELGYPADGSGTEPPPSPESVELRRQLAAVLGSRSWRMTAPLRWLAARVRGWQN